MSAAPEHPPLILPRTPLEAALGLRRDFGWSVIPINPNTKIPYVKWKPFQTRAASEEEIRAWYEKWPRAGVAIVTGAVSHLWVIEADTPEAQARLDALGLPPTPTVRSRRGHHYYFRRPGPVGTTARDGLDQRGDGGLAVAPPSLRTTEAGTHRYSWEPGLSPWDIEPAVAPQALVDLFADQRASSAGARSGTHNSESGGVRESYAALLANGSPQGQRNGDAARLAGYLLSRDLPAEVVTTLLDGWASRCRPAFPRDELAAVVASVAATHARNHQGADDVGSADTSERPAATTVAAQRERIARLSAENAECRRAYDLMEKLVISPALTNTEKKTLVHVCGRHGYHIGFPVPTGVWPRFIESKEITASGVGEGAYRNALRKFESLGLFGRERRQPVGTVDMDTPPADRSAGRPYDLWKPVPQAIEEFLVTLPTLTEPIVTERDHAVTAKRRTGKLEASALRQQVASMRHVAQERDEARHEAAQAAHALAEAQSILQQHQRANALACRGCGTKIDPDLWRCDDCREREAEERRPSAGPVLISVEEINGTGHTPGRGTHTGTLPSVSSTEINCGTTHLPEGPALAPCNGRCGTLTPHGWTCGPCNRRFMQSETRSAGAAR